MDAEELSKFLIPQPQGYFQTNTRYEAPPPQQNFGQDEQFVKNEKVLVFHGAMLYEATIMRVNESRPRKPYSLKFTGFGSKYNTWAGSDILIKDLPENRLYQDELKANLQQSMILKNLGKTPNPPGAVSTFTPEAVSVVPSTPVQPPTEPAPPSVPVQDVQRAPSPTYKDEIPAIVSSHNDSEATETDDSEEEALEKLVSGIKSDSKSSPSKTTDAALQAPDKKTKKRSSSTGKSPQKSSQKGSVKTNSKDQTPKPHKKKKTSHIPTAEGAEAKLYCICRKPEVWPMIGCDICADWFHLSCVGLTPSDTDHMDTYACPACTKV